MSSSSTTTRKRRPATTPEARERQLIAMSYDLAEKQLREGTASSQIIHHFLQRGAESQRLAEEKTREEIKHLKAKTKAVESQEKTEEFYNKVLQHMKRYAGYDDGDEDDN